MPVADSCARIRVWDVLEQAQALRRPSPAAPFSAWRGRYASTIRLLTLALPERELAIGRWLAARVRCLSRRRRSSWPAPVGDHAARLGVSPAGARADGVEVTDAVFRLPSALLACRGAHTRAPPMRSRWLFVIAGPVDRAAPSYGHRTADRPGSGLRRRVARAGRTCSRGGRRRAGRRGGTRRSLASSERYRSCNRPEPELVLAAVHSLVRSRLDLPRDPVAVA